MADLLKNRLVLMVLTAMSSSVGTYLLAAYPGIHAGICGVA